MILLAAGAGLQAASTVLNSVFVGAGLLAVAAVVANWNWFFDTASARAVGGRNRRSARILYGVVGVAIFLTGVVGLFDNLE